MLCVSWGGDSLAAVLPGPFPLLMALSYCSGKSVLCKSLLCPPAWSVPVPLLSLRAPSSRAGTALSVHWGCGALLWLSGKAEMWEEAHKNIKHLLAFLWFSRLGGGNKTEIWSWMCRGATAAGCARLPGVCMCEKMSLCVAPVLFVCRTRTVRWHFASPGAWACTLEAQS